jgi:ribosome recycling factor
MLEETENKINEAVEHFKEEIAKIRTGRAHSDIVDDVLIDYYGEATPLKELASISIPEPRQLKIEVWDENVAKEVEKALAEEDLGAAPNRIDEKTIVINLPSLTQETRKRMVDKLHEKAEKARVAVRNIRESKWKETQKQEQEGEITEDDKFTIKDRLQDLVDEANEEIEEAQEKKEEKLKE